MKSCDLCDKYQDLILGGSTTHDIIPVSPTTTDTTTTPTIPEQP